MNRAKFAGMSREEIVATMASKLAEGDGGQKVYKSKKRLSSRTIFIFSSAAAFISIITLWYILGNDTQKESEELDFKKVSFVYSHNPLTKLKSAFHDKKISADHFALYCKDVLVRYDSVPAEYRINRPVVSQHDIYRELSEVWAQLSPAVRARITSELPQFRVKEQDR